MEGSEDNTEGHICFLCRCFALCCWLHRLVYPYSKVLLHRDFFNFVTIQKIIGSSIIVSDMHYFAFSCIEAHLPFFGPPVEVVNVFLHPARIFFVFHDHRHLHIISKLPQQCVEGCLVNIIYENVKQYRAKYRSL